MFEKIAVNNLSKSTFSTKSLTLIIVKYSLMKKVLSFLFVALFFSQVFSQNKVAKVVQFSGFVMTSDSLMGIPYANIYVKKNGRGAIANAEGYFSLVAEEGDTLIFTSIGFTPSVYVLPTNLPSEKYSVIQLMVKTTYYLPSTIIFPWGDKDGFKRAFREINLPKDRQERAEENTNRQLLAALGENMPPDGNESAARYMQTRAAAATYYGQSAPNNLINPLAWAEFFKAWKRGDFKKKEKYVQPAPTE